MANGYELVTEAHTDPRTGVTKFVIYETSGHPKFWGFGRTYEEAEKAFQKLTRPV